MSDYAALIEKSVSMRDLTEIALHMLRRQSANGSVPLAQVCGPISTGGFNDLKKNLDLFQYTISLLEKRGVTVFDQTVFQDAIIRITKYDPRDTSYKTVILKDFFRDIFCSGYIKTGYFIPTWKTSRGSRWEYGLLCQQHIDRLVIPRQWYPSDIFC